MGWLPDLIPPQPESARVESCQQARIIDCNLEAGLARASVSLSERERDLLYRPDVTKYQYLQQQFESGALERNALKAFAANKEEAGHGVFGAESRPLNGPRHPHCGGRDQFPHQIPIEHAATRRVPAANHQVAAGINCRDQCGQKLWGMLKIGVHYAKNCRIGVLPAVKNRP